MMKKERNYGLDMLRMVCMFLIVNLHVLSPGGAMARMQGNESTYYACWFLETCAYCAVDCYGILSGYVGITGRHRPARLLELWLNVFFYSAGITLLYWIAAPDLLMENSLWKAIFPVSWGTYWYFSAYAGLFIVMPYLNKLVNALDEKERRRMILVMFLLFCVVTAVPKVNQSDFLQLVGGYSFVWLVILYLFGACIRTCSFKRWKKYQYACVYFALTAFSWAFKIVVENHTREMFGEPRFGRLFTGYTTPTIFLSAVCLFLIFENVKIRKTWLKRIIMAASPVAFSVYIIHTHPLIWENIIKGISANLAFRAWWAAVPGVLGIALCIYISCSLIDYVRKTIFDLCGVRKLTERIFHSNNI